MASYINSLFTSTSAVCVTGLSAVDITSFTLFGQIVIMLLIQVGGLGFMTVISLIFIFAGKRITLKDRLVMQEQYSQNGLSGLIRTTKKIVVVTFVCEGIGAILLMVAFLIEGIGFWDSFFYGMFDSVSAFCNAGLSLVKAGSLPSLESYYSNVIVCVTIMAEIIIGGIGFIAIIDIGKNRHWRKISYQTKGILLSTAALILFGALVTGISEWNNADTIGNMTVGEKIMSCFFQSVTARTAGFATVDQSKLFGGAQASTILLMFIGASPSGTGGGVKTISLLILLFTFRSGAVGDEEVVVHERKINNKIIVKVISLIALALTTIMFSVILIALFESGNPNISLASIEFECVSAYGTVGLSYGITPLLSVPSKIVLIVEMYLGRLSILVIGLFHKGSQQANIRYIDEKISL
ncbi:MAG: potassium transporter TrkG [Clostridia bacterium]